jgi:hypothetical protein
LFITISDCDGIVKLQNDEILKIPLIPQIKNVLVVSVLSALQHILDTDLYEAMLSDVIRNSIVNYY